MMMLGLVGVREKWKEGEIEVCWVSVPFWQTTVCRLSWQQN